ncbi:hypothetical protein JHK86_022131 [Glycine max]|nr:hypothetical protein JHK86_022131 [Glycine max]
MLICLNGEGAEKDDEDDIGEKREKSRIAVGTLIVDYTPNYQRDYRLSSFCFRLSHPSQFPILNQTSTTL